MKTQALQRQPKAWTTRPLHIVAVLTLSLALGHCASTEEEGFGDEYANGNFSQSADNFAFDPSEEGGNEYGANAYGGAEYGGNEYGESTNNFAENEFDNEGVEQAGEGEFVNNFAYDNELSQDNLANIDNQGMNSLFNNEANQGIAGLNNGYGGNLLNPNAVVVSDNLLNAAVNGAVEDPYAGVDSELINAATTTSDVVLEAEMPLNAEMNISTEAAPAAEMIESPASGLLPSGERGRVRYVLRRTGIYANPGNSVPVNHFDKGDHPLFRDAGEYQRLSDGRVVYGRDLTDYTVGRTRHPAPWMSQGHFAYGSSH